MKVGVGCKEEKKERVSERRTVGEWEWRRTR